MLYRTFFHLAALGEDVSSAEPLSIPGDRLWDDLVTELSGEDDFVGLIDNDENVLQILPEAGGTYWVELPRFAERTSFGRSMSAEELQTLLTRLPARFTLRSFPDFERRPW